MAFHVSAECVPDPVSEIRQTEASALGLALDCVDRGCSVVEIRETETEAKCFEDFLRAYTTARPSKPADLV